MERVTIGVIGLGNMGSTHVKSLLDGMVPELQLAAVADIDPGRIEAIKTLPGMEQVAAYPSGEALIAAADVEAVLIATPHYLHSPLAIAAFERGLHVMCEKPAGVYTKAVAEMNLAAEKSGKAFGLMFNQRTDGLYRRMHEVIQSGELGEMKRVTWIITNWYRSQSYYDSGAWRATWAGEGGGVLLNQCPHNLDLLQWLCGLPTRVRAFCQEGRWHDIEVEDDVTAYLEYEGGATGVFVTSTGETPGTNRLEVSFDGGKLLCENGKLLLYRLNTPERQFNRTYQGGFGEPGYTVTELSPLGESLQHIGVLRAFAGHIRRGEPLVAKGQEGIRGLMLSNAMHLSSWLGETVSLPLNEDLFYEKLMEKVAGSRLKDAPGRHLDTEGTY